MVTGTLAEDGDTVGVPSELLAVVLDPDQGGPLVPQGQVTCHQSINQATNKSISQSNKQSS